MTKPIVALDLDGVLNPLTRTRPHGFDIVRAPFGQWWLSAVHGRWIQSLRQYADVMWASAWERDANMACEYYGISPLPFMTFPTVPECDSWKSERVLSYAGDSPLVWIDDEIYPDAHETMSNRGIDTLLVKTNARHGLHKRDFEQVLEFIKNV